MNGYAPAPGGGHCLGGSVHGTRERCITLPLTAAGDIDRSAGGAQGNSDALARAATGTGHHHDSIFIQAHSCFLYH